MDAIEFARRVTALHAEFSAGIAALCAEFAGHDESADAARGDAARTRGEGTPAKPPRAPALAAPVRGKVDPVEFAADWPSMSYPALRAKYGISDAGIGWWRRKLDLPKKARGLRKPAAMPAASARPRPAEAARAARAPDLPPPAKPVPTGLPPAPFDESGPVSIDAVIKFLRGRDVSIGVLPPDADGARLFRIDGRKNVDRVELLRIANRKRALMGKPEFQLEGG